MNYIEHIVEPSKLLLSWQPPDGPDRGRHIVAELRRTGDDADLVYLTESLDYQEARKKGFSGEYPGLPATEEHCRVLQTFMRRLPPRTRGDFGVFLEAIRIRPGTGISDFALLGYAGAKLPGDDFTIIHPFDHAKPPFEFLLLIAGYRHHRVDVPLEALRPDLLARFELEPANKWDPNAVRVVIPAAAEATAGHVCRGLLPQFRAWLAEGIQLSGTVERINGTSEHPLVYLFVSVREKRARQ